MRCVYRRGRMVGMKHVCRMVLCLLVISPPAILALSGGTGADSNTPPVERAARFRLPVAALVAGDFGPAPEHPERGEVFLCANECLAKLGSHSLGLTAHNVHLDASARSLALNHDSRGVMLDASRFSALSGRVEITLEGNKPTMCFSDSDWHPRLILQFQEQTSAIVARDARGSLTWSFP
jgi:hypothetical protein